MESNDNGAPKLPSVPRTTMQSGEKNMAKGMKGAKTSKGFVGGGKESGFVNTPMNTPKKGFKGGK
jgi:hypothetical protein